MFDRKAKYVILKEYNRVIIFSDIIQHDMFQHMEPISAGFLYFKNDMPHVYGESISLCLKSRKEDEEIIVKEMGMM